MRLLKLTHLRRVFRSHYRRTALLGAASFWIIAISSGLVVMDRFQMTPGAASAATQWPAELAHSSELALATDRPTLVMFLHPKCSCSRASLEELSRLTSLCPNRAAIEIVFFKPLDAADDWMHTDLWRTAATIQSARVLCDLSGKLAERFDAKTSGQVLLFEPGGRVIFSGGITGSRGHAGDNAGLDTLAQLVKDPAKLVHHRRRHQ